ncbi:MAG: endonuclease/exonuclease/phosphatase family protein [Verrucomicrobiae bacterium]|nr:endonuclease/exonuclease/phosphatase family protein [Verrucomicrobiae bacterium]
MINCHRQSRRVRYRPASLAVVLFWSVAISIAATAADENSATEPIRFVAWNLKNYLAMERRVSGEIVSDAPKPEDEIERVIATLAEAKPDILGVCELGDAGYLEDLRERLSKNGVDLPHTELIISADGWNRNLALLSRFPIVSRDSRNDLTYLIGQTRFPVQRGFLDVTVAVNESYRLRCLGLHLKSKREIPEADQSEMRRNEAHLIRQHIDTILDKEPGTNLLVYGDFNDTPNETPVKAIRGRFGSDTYLGDLRPTDPFGFRWTHYWSYADTYSRFDYLLFSDGLKSEIDKNSAAILHPEDWEKASDHRALTVKLIPKDR